MVLTMVLHPHCSKNINQQPHSEVAAVVANATHRHRFRMAVHAPLACHAERSLVWEDMFFMVSIGEGDNKYSHRYH